VTWRLKEMLASRIGRRMALATLVFAVLVVLILTSVQLYSTYRRGMQEVEESFAIIQRGYLANLSHDLWVYDSEQIEIQLEAMLHLPGIALVVLKDAGGESWSAGRSPGGAALRRSFPMARMERGRPLKLGALEVAAGLDGVRLAVWRQAAETLVQSTVGVFLLAAFVLVMFHVLVTRHLLGLAEALRGEGPLTDGLQGQAARGDEIGQVAGAVGDMQRQLMQQLEALKGSEASYRNLFDTSPVAIFVQDFSAAKTRMDELARRHGDLEAYLGRHREETARLMDMVAMKDANPATLELYEAANREELIAQPVSRLVPPAGGTHPTEQLLAFHRGETYFQSTGVNRTLKNNDIDVLVRKVVAPGHEHDLSLVMASVVDLTEIRRVQEAKDRMERQLRQAQKLEAIGTLAGGIAHDLNNLLSPIIGYGELLEEELAADQPRGEMVRGVLQAALRARDLVGQLLAYSRKQTLRIRAVDLNSVVGRFQRLLRRTITEDIVIETTLWAEPLVIRADAGQLEQVVMNLAVNAQDAMPGGGRLSIDTARVVLDQDYAGRHPGAEPGPHAMLAVTDTGMGMDQSTLARVFDPFFTTKSQGKGTGLGLATVYGIVKQQEGHIWVYSEPGQGTTFKIYFPLAPDEPVGDRPRAAAGAEVSGRETVLVVEDNDMVRKMAAELLERQGYRALSAEGGEECLELVAGHRGDIDLLLTDVVMPDMNGRELYERLVQDRPGLKVLYMSGYTENVVAHRGVLDQGVDFIHKPFTVADLGNKVRQVLDA